MAKIFISYAHKDDPQYEICEQLCQDRRIRKYNPTYDRDILVGSFWKKELERKIIEHEIFLCLISPNWFESQYCQWEFDIALANRRAILPVCIIEFPSIPLDKIHSWFKDKQWKTAEIDNKKLSQETISDIIYELGEIKVSLVPKSGIRGSANLSVGGVNDLDWISIPPTDLSSSTLIRQKLDAFKITKQPLAVYKFDTFVSNGFDARTWWHFSEEAYEWRLNSSRPANIRNRNALVGFSWFDAIAYSNWLADMDRVKVRLPMQIELETALSQNLGVESAPNLLEWCINPIIQADSMSLDGNGDRAIKQISSGKLDFIGKPPSYQSDNLGFRLVMEEI